ncbi:hypothetical protein CNY67_14685 [Desulfovibrio sp. G11]|nr:hypothetical protein CNY67_14685 [Desulfovibrio sp. G11]
MFPRNLPGIRAEGKSQLSVLIKIYLSGARNGLWPAVVVRQHVAESSGSRICQTAVGPLPLLLLLIRLFTALLVLALAALFILLFLLLVTALTALLILLPLLAVALAALLILLFFLLVIAAWLFPLLVLTILRTPVRPPLVATMLVALRWTILFLLSLLLLFSLLFSSLLLLPHALTLGLNALALGLNAGIFLTLPLQALTLQALPFHGICMTLHCQAAIPLTVIGGLLVAFIVRIIIRIRDTPPIAQRQSQKRHQHGCFYFCHLLPPFKK